MRMEVSACKGMSLVTGTLVAALSLGACSQGTNTDVATTDEVATEAAEDTPSDADNTEEALQATFPVTKNEEFGSVKVEIGTDAFHDLGFAYGDSVDLSFSSGYELNDIPYYSGYYTPIGDPILLSYPGNSWLTAAINLGDGLWDVAGLSKGDTVTITLKEKGAFLDIQEARDLTYTDEAADYASDEIFANFRMVQADTIAPNVLYRSCSPCDMKHLRAGVSSALAEANGIACFIDLADTTEKMEQHMADELFESDYFKRLYEEGAVILTPVTANYRSEDFSTKLANALTQATEHPTPWLVFCTEGKDRTGAVCLILEALAGATYDEIEADYMTSFANYYGVTKESDPDRYDTIVRETMDPMVAALFDEDKVDVRAVDLEEGARNYLMNSGMSEDKIDELKGILTGTVTSGEAE